MVAIIVRVGVPLDLLSAVVDVVITVLVGGPSSAHDDNHCTQY